MFGVPVPDVLEAFVSFLSSPTAPGATTLIARTPGDAPAWIPPELRVFAVAPGDVWAGVVIACPEHPAPDWPIALYTRSAGAQRLGQTARSGLSALVDRFAPASPDAIAESLLRVKLAVAAEPTGDWPEPEGLSRVTIADGLDLVVPRHTVDAADFRRAPTDAPLIPWLGSIAGQRPGSALALCRAAAFEAFRQGDDTLGNELRGAMAPLYRQLGRPGYADAGGTG